MFENSKISLILCSGGTGTRMGASLPKQYLCLNQKPIALYSFDLFVESPWIDEIVVVCENEYRSLFQCSHKPLFFASPGKIRQLSVHSGLLKTSPLSEFILVHDAARPFFDLSFLQPLLKAVCRTGAAALAAPIYSTVKEATPQRFVSKTLDRSRLWEMQTPQGLRRSLFFQSFAYAEQNKIEVTDDVSLAENYGHPVEIVPSSPRNFKITTPFDLLLAQTVLTAPPEKVRCATN